MALIKCRECGKDISDKSNVCIHCGCPINNKKIENDKNKLLFIKIWFIVCSITCIFISLLNFLNIFNIFDSKLSFGRVTINVMGILALLLASSYLVLLRTFKKNSLYVLLGINLLIFIYNIFNFCLLVKIFYIILILINSLITFFITRKYLLDNKITIKELIPLSIALFLSFVIIFIQSDNILNLNNGNKRNANLSQIKIENDYINLRDSRDINSKVLGKVHKGEIYTVINEYSTSYYDWFEIETKNGVRGFIAGKYGNNEYVKKLEANVKNNNITTTKVIETETTTKNKKITKETTTKKADKYSKTTTTKIVNNVTTTIVTNNKTTTTNKKEIIVDATKEAYCPDGEIRYKNGRPSYCERTYWDDTYLTKVCPSGYTYNSTKDICEKGEDKPNINPIDYPHCSDGSQVMYTNKTYYCRTGKFVAKKCPSGYTLESVKVGTTSLYSCVWQNPYRTKNSSDGCSKGKYYSSKNSCKVTDRISLSYQYTCRNGYTLKNDKCYKN